MNMSSTTDASTVGLFYDELAPYYDLIFEDWDASRSRQGEVIAGLMHRLLPDVTSPFRVLDATAGIGTQSIPLAQLGFDVTSRDLSPMAIARLVGEASRIGDDRFFLMALVVASFDDAIAERSVVSSLWARAAAILRSDHRLHAVTLSYWACGDDPDPDHQFAVTPAIRLIWHDVRAHSVGPIS
jgi:SAM-dependent methyltransferase